MNRRNLSVIQLQQMAETYQSVRDFVQSNSEIIEIELHTDEEIKIIDSSGKSPQFYFRMTTPTFANNNTIFQISQLPANLGKPEKGVYAASTTSIIAVLKKWVDIIKAHSKVKLRPDDSILKDYEKEIYDWFEIVDEDAETTAYDFGRQAIIHNYFVEVVKILELDKGGNAELIEEAKKIKDNIPNLTKKKTIKRMSEFFAKARKKSLPLFKELFDVGKKELFKDVVQFVFDKIGDILLIG